MRKNQVSIKIERFGDQVPEKLNGDSLEIEVYADANNIYEALAAAYGKVLEEITKYERLPSFGCAESNIEVRPKREVDICEVDWDIH